MFCAPDSIVFRHVWFVLLAYALCHVYLALCGRFMSLGCVSASVPAVGARHDPGVCAGVCPLARVPSLPGLNCLPRAVCQCLCCWCCLFGNVFLGTYAHLLRLECGLRVWHSISCPVYVPSAVSWVTQFPVMYTLCFPVCVHSLGTGKRAPGAVCPAWYMALCAWHPAALTYTCWGHRCGGALLCRVGSGPFRVLALKGPCIPSISMSSWPC